MPGFSDVVPGFRQENLAFWFRNAQNLVFRNKNTQAFLNAETSSFSDSETRGFADSEIQGFSDSGKSSFSKVKNVRFLFQGIILLRNVSLKPNCVTQTRVNQVWNETKPNQIKNCFFLFKASLLRNE